MNRRTFIQSTAIGVGLGLGNVRGMNLPSESRFIEKFGYDVVDFFNDDWDVENLEDELEKVVDFTCYAYGEIEELESNEEQDTSEDSGFLDRFQQINLKDLSSNPEAYNWILGFTDDIADLVKHLDVFPGDLGGKLDRVTTAGRKVTKFIPLIANIKHILDIGCDIYDKIDVGKSPTKSTYVRFFKHVALTIVEAILLLTGTAVSYKVAFGATGWVNQRIINVIGRKIGWRAYSWILSQVHRGIRITFAENMGQAISNVTETISEKLVTESSDTANPLSESEAGEIAKRDVKEMADHTDEWGTDYEIWKINQQREQTLYEASQRRKSIIEKIEDIQIRLRI